MEKEVDKSENASADTASVEYINFGSLVAFSNISEVELKISGAVRCIESVDSFWVEIFDSFNNLRSVIKFNLDALLDVVVFVNPHVLRNLISIRSNLSKVALQYLSDLFMKDNFQILEVALLSLPTLFLVHSQKGKRFLTDQTEIAVSNLIASFSSYRIASVLIKLLGNKNLDISTYAYKSIDLHLNLHHSSYSELKSSKIELILKGILVVYKINKEPYTKMALSIVKKLSTYTSLEELKLAISNLKGDKSLSYELLKMLNSAKVQ